MNDQASPPRRSWRRRLLLWLGVPLLLLAGWLIGMYAILAYIADRDLREAIEDIERSEPVWRLADLEAARKPVADEDNSALRVIAARKLLPPNWPLPVSSGEGTPLTPEERLGFLPPERQLDDALAAEMRAELKKAEVAPALAEARKLIGMSEGRFPLEIIDNTLAIQLASQDARAPANLLRWDAIVRAHDRDADGAAASVRGVLAVGRSLGDEPFLISMLIRLACQGVAVHTLERVLAQGEPSAGELEAVQRLLEKEAAEPLLLTAMRGERAGLHQLTEAVKKGDVSLMQAVGTPGTGFGDRLGDAAGPMLARRSHARLLRLMTELVEAAKLPPEEQGPRLKEVEQKIRQAKVDHDVWVALIMPAVVKPSDGYRRGLGSLRCGAVAVALERYRRDHDDWPKKLDDLTPKYLSAVPRDPGDGKPLRYLPLDDGGVLVYWTGVDGEDNGGALNRANPIAKGTDQGFRLWEARDHRRQPAVEVMPPPTEELPPPWPVAEGPGAP